MTVKRVDNTTLRVTTDTLTVAHKIAEITGEKMHRMVDRVFKQELIKIKPPKVRQRKSE